MAQSSPSVPAANQGTFGDDVEPPPAATGQPAQRAATANLASASRPTDQWDRLVLAEAHVGLGTPVGFFGLMLGLEPARYWTISAGVGQGDKGIQGAGHTRLRLPVGVIAFGVGAGISHGKYAQPAILGCCEGDTHVVTWVNCDAGVEVRTRSGINMRGYIGRGAPVDDVWGRNDLAYLGASVGYAFVENER